MTDGLTEGAPAFDEYGNEYYVVWVAPDGDYVGLETTVYEEITREEFEARFST